MAQKPRLPKGTRDFGPEEMRRRHYIFDILQKAFEHFGFQPLETPAMETMETLTGKYGEEGDRLLFKLLNNGDFLSNVDEQSLLERDSNKLTGQIASRGLRYDLTVPFARHVVMNRHKLAFPFKRYQMQPVWRADRPQRGRYREFYQCDADVVGSSSLMYEAELIQLYDRVFSDLNISVFIRINHRQILAGLAELAGVQEDLISMTVAIDKLDKIGLEGVKKELTQRGFTEKSIQIIEDILATPSLEALRPKLVATKAGKIGLEEMDKIHDYLDENLLTNKLQFDVTLARGLGYYTGPILEVNALNVNMGSIGGGGRYADLTGIFGMPNMPGVGISFGLERIYDILLENDGFPDTLTHDLQALLIAFDDKSHRYAYKQLQTLRSAGLAVDIYPEPAKLKKQMKYADDRQVPFVLLVGDREMENDVLMMKNMQSGEQEALPLQEVIARIKSA